MDIATQHRRASDNPNATASVGFSAHPSGRNPCRVGLGHGAEPKLAVRRQPWAGRRNPCGIRAGKGRGLAGCLTLLRRERRAAGFTLVELLVVIAVIAALAALIVGIAPKAFDARTRSRIETEMQGLTTVIERYQDKLGFYPPDNPKNSARPPLYYELTGTTSEETGGARSFTAVDHSTLTAAQVQNAFNVPGFLNTAPSRDGVKNFHESIPPSLIKQEGDVRFIVASAPGPDGAFNPWHYDAHSPDRHNPESFDLWAVIVLRGQNVTIGNWKRE